MNVYQRIKEGDYLVLQEPTGWSYHRTYTHTNDINEAFTSRYMPYDLRKSVEYQAIEVKITRIVEIVK